MSEPQQLPAPSPPQQLLADWDAGKPVKLYVARGPEFVNHPQAILAAKVQMESLRLVLKTPAMSKSKWNGMSQAAWNTHVEQAITAAGAQALDRGAADDAANIGGIYMEAGVDVVQRSDHTTVMMTKNGPM